jgi:hypothetical protein
LHSLQWLKTYPSANLWYKMYLLIFETFSHSEVAIFVCISALVYSFYFQKKNIIWLLICLAVYSGAIFYSGFNLGLSRYTVPLYLLTLYTLAEALSILKEKLNTKAFATLVTIIVFTQLKATTFSFMLSKSAWLEAANHFCSEAQTVPVYLFGHQGIKYYFKDCAIPTWNLQGLPLESRWLVSLHNENEFQKNVRHNYGDNIALTKLHEYNLKSNEPVLVYNLRLN